MSVLCFFDAAAFAYDKDVLFLHLQFLFCLFGYHWLQGYLSFLSLKKQESIKAMWAALSIFVEMQQMWLEMIKQM